MKKKSIDHRWDVDQKGWWDVDFSLLSNPEKEEKPEPTARDVLEEMSMRQLQIFAQTHGVRLKMGQTKRELVNAIIKKEG